MLTLKELTPVRLMKNEFFQKLEHAYAQNASIEELSSILGRGRAKKGMFEGDLVQGELEIGQIAGNIDAILPAASIIQEIITEFLQAKAELNNSQYTF